MSRFDALTRDLAAVPADQREKRYSFADVEELVGPLPASARRYRPWWGNSTHGQALSWQSAGWIVDAVNMTAELVVFVRGEAQRRTIGSPVVTRRITDLVSTPGSAASVGEDDHTEAAVQARLATYLAREGWQIQRVADTVSREQGIDVVASREGRILAVEVKGYPSRSYADPRRAGEAKPTNPSVQARHWYAMAMLKVVLTRDEHPGYEVAMAFPDMPTYRSLLRRTQSSVAALSIGVFFVSLDGQVEHTTHR